jgi:hypothetical protein
MDLDNEIEKECIRIEEDCNYSSKGHFEASACWKRIHLWIGIPSAIMAGVAGVSAFEENTLLAGVLAILVAAMGAVSTFLNPSNKASEYYSSASSYLELRNRVRRFRNIEVTGMDSEEAKERILAYGQQKDDLSSSTPQIPEWAFKKARDNIEDGQTNYVADKT